MPSRDKSILIAGIISVVRGVMVLVTSSLLLNDYIGTKPDQKLCDAAELLDQTSRCEMITFLIVAADLGIVGGILQIGSFFLAWKKYFMPFAITSAAVSFFCLIALALAVDRGSALDTSGSILAVAVAFVTSLGIDTVFALVTGVYMQTIKDKK